MTLFSRLACGLAVLLAGCTVGPDYHPPETSAPAGWVSAAAIAPDADGVQREWWKNFHDPILDQLIAQAAASNLDLKIAEARIAQARATRASAAAQLLPKGDVMASATREANQFAVPGASFPGLTEPFNIFQTGFDASWELDLFGGHRRDVEAATAQLAASEATRDDVMVSLLAEVARSYIDMRGDQTQLMIAQDTVKSDTATLDIASQRVKVGQSPGIDVTQARLQVEQAEVQLPALRNRLAQTAFSLDVLLGQPPGAALKLVGDQGAIPVSDTGFILTAPARVIANRPDIRVAERSLAAATAQQGVAVAQFFPDISLTGFLGLLNTDAGQLFKTASRSYLGAAKIAWPILSYGLLQANLDAANAAQQEALAQYQKTVLTAFSDVERAVTAYSEQQHTQEALAKTVLSSQQAVKVANERYKGGLTSFLEVLDAERSVNETQWRLAEANAQLSMNLVAVYKSLGGGWQPTKAPL